MVSNEPNPFSSVRIDRAGGGVTIATAEHRSLDDLVCIVGERQTAATIDAVLSIMVGEGDTAIEVGFVVLHGTDWRRRLAQFSVELLPAFADPASTIPPSQKTVMAVVSEVVGLVAAVALDNLNLHRLETRIADGSAWFKAVDTTGFVHEGTLRQHRVVGGRYVNVHLFGLLASDVSGRREGVG